MWLRVDCVSIDLSDRFIYLSKCVCLCHVPHEHIYANQIRCLNIISTFVFVVRYKHMIYICCVALRRTAINARVNVCWKQQLATWMTEHREEDRHGRRSACMRSIFWLAIIQIIWRNYTQTLNQAYIRIICELILLFLFQMCSKKTNGKHGEIIHDVIQYTIVYTFRWFDVTLVGSSDLVASKPFIYNSIRWKLHRMQSVDLLLNAPWSENVKQRVWKLISFEEIEDVLARFGLKRINLSI